MAEALQRAPDGGAVAVWGSSGLTDATTQALMNRELFRQIFGGAATLGDAILAAKRVVMIGDVRRTWVLFGDPALHLAGAPLARSQPAPAASRASLHDEKKTKEKETSVTAGELTQATTVPTTIERLADIDGDGRADTWLYIAADGRWMANPSSGVGERVWQGQWPADSQVVPLRLNRGTAADVLLSNRTTSEWWQGLNSGKGQFTWTHGYWPRPMPGGVIRAADLRGIGRDDVIVYDRGTGSWVVARADGVGGFTFTTGQWPGGVDLRVGDVNGDGRADVIGYNALTGHAFVALSTGTGQFLTTETTWTAGHAMIIANLDGATAHVILYDGNTGTWQVRAPSRSGMPIVASGAWMPGLTLYATDFTADGSDDVFGYDPDSGRWALAVTMGLGQFELQTGFWSTGWSVGIGDVTGEGRADVVLYDATTGVVFNAITLGQGVFAYQSTMWPPEARLVGRAP